MIENNHPQGYYTEALAAERLKKCYDIAPPKVQAYLQGEIDFVRSQVSPTDIALELGCGYGRVLREVAPHVRQICGIDTSPASLHLAREYMGGGLPCHLAAMDAVNLGFADGTFDVVLCIQNGISAFHVDQRKLIAEALRVTRKGGMVLFSSYAEAFWDDRLDWFRLQTAHGLIGEIDEAATGGGRIVCKEGFTATTVTPDDFHRLAASVGVAAEIIELQSGALFCEMKR